MKKSKDIFAPKELIFALLVIVGGIVFLETVALIKGIDGAIYGASMTAIGAIGGYILKAFLSYWKRNK